MAIDVSKVGRLGAYRLGAVRLGWAGASGASGISIAVTETGPSFTESINTNLSVSITGAIVENGPAFTDAVNVTLTSLTSIVENGPSFTESIIAFIPITVNPKNIIRVKRKDNAVIIKRKSNIIRVR